MKRRLERLLDEADEAADFGDWTKVREVATRVLLIDDANVDASDFPQLSELTLPEDQRPKKTWQPLSPARRTRYLSRAQRKISILKWEVVLTSSVCLTGLNYV